MVDTAVSDADRVESLWARLEAWLGGQVPRLAAGLAPSADEPPSPRPSRGWDSPLPAVLRRLLTIHNGGSEVIGGWDLLSADGIATAYKTIQKYAGEPERAPAWVPFGDALSGDLLCVDLALGATGTVGQVFMYYHDDDPGPPIAATLVAWLEGVVVCLEAGGIVYDPAREEFLPFFGATGFAVAFAAEPPLLLGAGHPEAVIRGPRRVGVRAVESVGPLPTHVRIELAEVGVLTGMWDLDVLRQTEDSATEYNVLVEGPAPVVTVAAEATLRLSGLTGDDTVWVHLTTDGGESC